MVPLMNIRRGLLKSVAALIVTDILMARGLAKKPVRYSGE